MRVNSSIEYNHAKSSWVPYVTDRDRETIELVNIVSLSGLIAVFGIIANVINMAVFSSQGLNTVINVSFFALAISDLTTLLFQVAWAILSIPMFRNLELSIDYTIIPYVTIAIPREGFARDTCLITAFMTVERCLCIVFPQTVKHIITPNRARLVVVCVYFGTFMTGVPMLMTYRLDWKIFNHTNRTFFTLSYIVGSQAIQKFVFIVQAITLLASVTTVVVLTFVLVVKLQEASAWRVSAHVHQTVNLSRRDRSAISMVVLIATILIVCYTPAVILCIITFCDPDFSIHGPYANFFWSLWSFVFLFETINSSVNIFVYFKMSTNYRRTFESLFIHCIRFNCLLSVRTAERQH